MRKLSYKERQKLREVTPLITAMLKNNDGILPIAKVEQSYGTDAVVQALEDNVIKKITLVRSDALLKDPARKIPCVHLPAWNREKPSWFK